MLKLGLEMDVEEGVRHHHPHHHHAAADLKADSPSKHLKLDRFLWLRKIFLFSIIFFPSCSMIIVLFFTLFRLGAAAGGDEESVSSPWMRLRLPSNVEELKQVRDGLEKYQEQHRQLVRLAIMCLYLFLQTFMFPGSIFLNILAGSLYGFYEAVLLVTVLASVGSSLCYMLSRFILKDIVYYYFPARCDSFAKDVHAHRHHLLNYVLFLRITPVLPNWFINVSAPLVAVPFREFFLGTFVGVIPASVIAVKAGRILSQLNSLNDLYDFHTIAAICVLAFLVILPVLWKRRVSHGDAKAT